MCFQPIIGITVLFTRIILHVLSLCSAIHYFLHLPLNIQVSKRLFPSSILKKGDLIELIANYPTIFYSHNLTARFLLRPIFALYLTFRRGRQTLMDSYNFVSPTIGIASFFIDLVKFLADERRIKLFTALAATRSSTSSSLLNQKKRMKKKGGREMIVVGNRRFSPGLKLMVD